MPMHHGIVSLARVPCLLSAGGLTACVAFLAVELVAPISPLRALQSKDRKSLGSRSASHMEDLSLNFHETHKVEMGSA